MTAVTRSVFSPREILTEPSARTASLPVSKLRGSHDRSNDAVCVSNCLVAIAIESEKMIIKTTTQSYLSHADNANLFAIKTQTPMMERDFHLLCSCAMRVLSLLLAGMVFWSSVWAVSTEDILELLSAELDEETTTSDTATIDDITLEDLTHDEIIESFHDETYITREQFAYMLDLLTDDIDTVRDMDRCNFRDYETAQSILGLAAVNTLCHKGIVRGTYQTRYYYGAKLTEAEAVTMVVRALYLDEYDELKLAEASAPQ